MKIELKEEENLIIKKGGVEFGFFSIACTPTQVHDFPIVSPDLREDNEIGFTLETPVKNTSNWISHLEIELSPSRICDITYSFDSGSYILLDENYARELFGISAIVDEGNYITGINLYCCYDDYSEYSIDNMTYIAFKL